MKKRIKDNIPIILILTLACFVYIYGLWNAGYANTYYSAGVYSMGQNLHAFFFNSLDSVGYVTIDKPPLGFWIQVLFTKIFGFSGFTVLIPQAICGVLSVYLIYKIMVKRFGKAAGNVAALVTALSPIFVAISRNNTIDGILILFLVLATEQAIKAAEKSSIKHLIFAGILIGLGFNVKMLQAFMIIPAIYLTFLIFSKQKIWKRFLSCFVSGIILIVISLSWVVAVDLIPADSRPYVGSSDENSALELVFGHNGISRILGNSGKSKTYIPMLPDTQKDQYGYAPPQGDYMPKDQYGYAPPQGDYMPKDQYGYVPPQGAYLPKDQYGYVPPQGGDRPKDQYKNIPPYGNKQKPQQQGNTGKQSVGGETGEASVFRMFNENNAGQISWFLLPSIVIALAAVYMVFRKKYRQDKSFITYFMFAMSFIPIFIYFSFAEGITHRYYFAMLAPSIGALCAIGFVFLRKSKKIFIPITLIATGAVQIYIHNLYTPWTTWALWVAGGVFALTAIVMFIMMKKVKTKTISLLLAVLLLLPTIWSLTPVIYSDNSQLPIAGPELVNQNDSFDKSIDMDGIINYLEDNRGDATYLAMAPSSMTIGAELIVESGEAVMVLGGFNGADEVLSLEEFIGMVDSGEVRYAILAGNGNSQGGNNQILQWIAQNAQRVDDTEYGGRVQNIQVFDMK